ncbi:uncharacterized protein LOC126818741 [Patella vulgata]|uniref:uncharacterized protein LOC126818741 n=1 Tax=Patella vulgata TaxID=6465 RepID=UPI0024A859D5|nr:uncharacterized protein LOC126818741 [Patella vulgata]
MQGVRHNYEPVGCDNAGFDHSFTNREIAARRSLAHLFQKTVMEEATESLAQPQTESPDYAELSEMFEDIDLEIDQDDDYGTSERIKYQTKKKSISNCSLNTLKSDFSPYPIEARAVVSDTVLLDDPTITPTRTPSFMKAISASETGLEAAKKVVVPGPSLSNLQVCKSQSHKSLKLSPSSVTSLPTSPRGPNLTSTPGINDGTSNPHLSSSILSDTGICRICHEGDAHEELVAPCYCAGSVGVLHVTCLERWLGTSNTTRCEICKYQFKVERQARSFWQFLKQPSENTERRNMICDIVCFFILTPLTGISAFLCMMGVRHYAQWDGRWEVPGLAILTSCLLMIYAVWCFVAMRHHYKVCRDWQTNNQIIKIKYLSPTKGKAILETKPVQDKNQSYISPTRQNLISPCTSTPSPAGAVPSYNAAMLRPILRYSSNLQSFSSPSDHFPSDYSYRQSVVWSETEIGNSDRNNFISSSVV